MYDVDVDSALNIVSKNITPQQALAEAERLFSAQSLPQSEELCWRILKAQPTYHPAYFQLALIAVQVGKSAVAIDLVERALQFAPADSVYHRTLCELYRRVGRLDTALSHGAQAVTLAPKDAESHYNYGLALAENQQYDLAIKHYRKVLQLNPRHIYAFNNLGSACEKSGDIYAAEEAYKNAVRVNPKNAEAYNNLGALFSANGDLENARTCFDKAIEIAPAFVSAHCNISTIKKYKSEDPHIAMLEQLKTYINNVPVEEQIKYWFAYGKACNDTKRYSDSFESYQRGNLLKRSTYKYDESIMQKNIEDIIQRFDSKLLKKSSYFEDPTPVFIVGMPRSGTTLIEQIISSHSAVYGAGELKDLGEIICAEANLHPESSYIDWLQLASTDDLLKVAQRYVTRLREHDKKAILITDKMPGNFFFVGLIHMVFPKAKIIHCMRNPMDTCLSNYMILFKETLPFAYDLKELGSYYRMYDRLMKHWQSIMPADAMIEVSYEEVVNDLEGQARRIIEYCGLSWEVHCLEFYKNQRLVKTASVSQVRQPLYNSSVERWKPYEAWLSSLKEELYK